MQNAPRSDKDRTGWVARKQASRLWASNKTPIIKLKVCPTIQCATQAKTDSREDGGNTSTAAGPVSVDCPCFRHRTLLIHAYPYNLSSSHVSSPVVGPLASTVFPARFLRSPISDLSAASGLVSVKPTANCCTNCLLFPRIRQPSASSHLCLSLKLFFSSRTTARRSSSSLSSWLLYGYVLLMRMLSFSISLSQLLSRSYRFLSVYIPPTHVLVLSCLQISVIELPSVLLQFC